MNRLSVLLFGLLFLVSPARSQTAPDPLPSSDPAAPLSVSSVPPRLGTGTPAQSAVDRLAQSNRELLDLLKTQQAVLEDIQFDRRLQSRQIQSLEERLEESLQENALLQKKLATLETAAAAGPASQPSSTPPPPTVTTTGTADGTNSAPATALLDLPATPPSTYLPPPGSDGPPGTKSWHRLFTLSGSDNKNSDLFPIQGRTWRVLWHNLDKSGKAYANTSALFIHAFPKDDTIPQEVCSKLGTGGDATELMGPGNYYLKVEASGGSWELAVEDFR